MVQSPPVRCSCGGSIRKQICDRCGPKRRRKKTIRSHQTMYRTQKWRKASLLFRQQNPVCAECEKAGRVTPATLVDHIQPHKGDLNLFWNTRNWQSLCWRCHGIKSQKE